MIRRLAWATVMIVTFLAPTSPAWGQDRLAALTSQQISEILTKELDRAEGNAKVVDRVKAAAGTNFVPDPSGLSYTYANGVPTLVWSYPASAGLTPEQLDKLKGEIGKLLIEALVQAKGADGNSVLSDAEGQKLRDALTFKETTPPRPQTTPVPVTLSKIDDQTMNAGETKSVSFQVLNADPSTPTPKLSATSSDPNLVPPSTFKFGGEGVNLTMEFAAAPKMAGTSTINVTAEGTGWSASTPFQVDVEYTPPPVKPPGKPLPSGQTLPIATPQAYYTYGPYTQLTHSTICMPVTGHCGFRKDAWRQVEVCSASAPYYITVPATPPGLAAPQAVATASPMVDTVPSSFDGLASRPPVEASSSAGVPRSALLKGKKAGDWESLFHDGYKAFRAADYPQAVEYFAAAADLADDPRAWDFLALASIMTRDTKTAREAAQYSAARVHTKPVFSRDVVMALVEVDGPVRDRLMLYKSEVDQTRFARAILAARPKLRGEPADRGEAGMTAARGVAMTGR